MAGIGSGVSDPNAVPITSNTTPGVSALSTQTAAGSTVAGLYSVGFYNDSFVVATVAGATFAAGASASWKSPDNLGLGAIAYDPGVGGSLIITSQAFSTA